MDDAARGGGRGVAALAERGAQVRARGGGVHVHVTEQAQERAVLGAVEQRALLGAVVAEHAVVVGVRDDHHGLVVRRTHGSRCRWRGVPDRPRTTWCAAGRVAGGEGGGGGVSRIHSTVVVIRRRVGLAGGLVRGNSKPQWYLRRGGRP